MPLSAVSHWSAADWSLTVGGVQEIVAQLPELAGSVQVQLLNLLSQAIRGVPFHMCRKSYSKRLREAVLASQCHFSCHLTP